MKKLFRVKFLFPLFILFILVANIIVPNGTLTFLSPSNSFALLPEVQNTYNANITFIPNENYLPSILKDIESAQSRIYIAMFFFKTDGRKNNPSTKIERALMRAASKGINVNIVLEKSGRKKDLSTKVNKNTAKYLKKAGVHVRFDGDKNKLHSKAVVIDNIVYIGSHNYTRSAMSYNHETSVRITSDKLAEEVIQYIKDIP